MQETFNAEDLKNIANLITRCKDITGAEALPVALLQQKIQRMFEAAQKAEQPKPTYSTPEGTASAQIANETQTQTAAQPPQDSPKKK